MVVRAREEAKVAVKVVRVFKERVGDFTLVSFLADDGRNYIVSSETVPLSIYIQQGDKLVVTYLETGELFLPVKELTNVSME